MKPPSGSNAGGSNAAGSNAGDGPADDVVDVLEQNLRKLFARSYAPVLPAPAFRARLAAELEARLQSRRAAVAAGARPARGPRALPRRILVAAAAVLVLALGTWLAFFVSGRGGALSLEDVLARGCVALRAAGEKGWRAVDPREAQHGIEAGHRALEAATPVSLAVRLLFGAPSNGSEAASGPEEGAASQGHATLGPDSRVMTEIAAPEGNGAADLTAHLAATRAVHLEHGTLAVERYDSGRPWLLAACGARIDLERGAVELSVVDAGPFGGTGECLLAHVTRGVARAWIDGGLVALAPGTSITLQGDRALSTTVGAEDPRTGSTQTSGSRTSATGANEPVNGADATHADPTKTTVATAAAATARIEGRVTAPEGLARPRKYTVTLLRHESLPRVSNPQSTTFDGSERFVIDGLEPGIYEVFVESGELAVWRGVDVALAAGATRTLEVELARGLTLRGRVLDAQSGAPIEGAIVLSEEDLPAQIIPFRLEPMPAWNALAVTLSDGTFEIPHVGAGPHVLRATKAGHGAAWSAPVDPASNEKVVLRLGPGGAIAGHVAHPDGTPWRGAIVIASQLCPSASFMRMGYSIDEADALGDYRIDDLPAGAFVVLNVQDAASIAGVRQATVAAGATTTIDIPERTSGSGWSGRVLDHEGHALAALDVTLQPAGVRGGTGWSTKRSDTDGKFAFDGLKSGSYDVYVGGDMGRRFVRQETIEIPIAGQLAHDIRLDAGAIRGRVVRAQDGTPCGECFLLVETRTATGFVFAGIDATEPDGSFALERLRAGTWRVTAFPSARGIAQATSRDLVIAPDALELTCELSLPRGATLRVAVRDAAGLGIPGTAVEFVNERGERVQLTASDVTGPDGVLDVPGVAAGRWKLRAQRGAQSSEPVVIDLLPGDEREVALTFAP